MIKVGITGGIGSGKTTVCRVFELFGIPVFYADEESKKILDEDTIAKEKIIKTFGDEIVNESGMIDRKKLAVLVFNNKIRLELLNSVLHPAVGRKFEEWAIKHQDNKYVLKEAAILFESGAYKQVDKTITVASPMELRINRSLNRDGITLEQIQNRMKYQMSDKDKIKQSQFVIYNDEEQLLIPQIIKIHQSLSK